MVIIFGIIVYITVQATSIVRSCIDYIDITNGVIDDNDDVDDLNKTLNELKNNLNEDLKECFRTNLKLKIMNELKLGIKDELKKELKNEIEGGAINNLKSQVNIRNPSKEIKSTRNCCLCKIEKK